MRYRRIGLTAFVTFLATILSNDALVMGNLTMPSVPSSIGGKSQQLAAFPGTEREVKAIAKRCCVRPWRLPLGEAQSAPLLNTQPLIGNQAHENRR